MVISFGGASELYGHVWYIRMAPERDLGRNYHCGSDLRQDQAWQGCALTAFWAENKNARAKAGGKSSYIDPFWQRQGLHMAFAAALLMGSVIIIS